MDLLLMLVIAGIMGGIGYAWMSRVGEGAWGAVLGFALGAIGLLICIPIYLNARKKMKTQAEEKNQPNASV